MSAAYAEGVCQFQFRTPKALANFSPGLERSDNPGLTIDSQLTLKGFVAKGTLSGLKRFLNLSQGCRFAPTLGWNWRTPSALIKPTNKQS